MPCPDLPNLPQQSLSAAVAVFDGLCRETLLPVSQAHADSTRTRIDTAVCTMLGLSTEAQRALKIIRLLWCKQPTVHGGNEAALRKLAENGPAEA